MRSSSVSKTANAPQIGETLAAAEELLGRGCLNEAVAAARELLDRQPANIAAMRLLARIKRRLGDDVSACDYLRMAVAADPDHAQALAEFAATLRELDRPEEAASIYGRLLARKPADVSANIGLAWIARARQNDEAATAHFAVAVEGLRQAAAKDPNNLGLQGQLATVLRELGQAEEAAAIYRDILAKKPGHSVAHMGLGRIARNNGDDDAALGHFKAACEANPTDLQAHIALGRVLTETLRFDEAEAIYRRMVERAPHNAQIRGGFGRLALKRRDFQGALEQFTAAVKCDPGNIPMHAELGRTFHQLGRWEDAERTYRSILEYSPGNVDALIGLARAAEGRGDRAEALTLFEDAARAAPLDLCAKQEIRRLKRRQGEEDWRAELEDALTAVRSADAPVQTQIKAAELLVLKYGLTEPARPALLRLEERLPAARKLLLIVRQIERLGLVQKLSESPDGSGPADDRLETLKGFIEMPVPNAETLLIVFAGVNDRPLLHRILRKTGVSTVYCQDLDEAYYTRGILGLGDDFQSAVEGFKALSKRYGAKRMLTLGNCRGVQGALRFGLSLGAQGVLGLGAKFRQDASLKPEVKARIAAIREHLPAEQRGIYRDYMEAAVRPNVDLLFGEHYSVDTTGVRAMADVPGLHITGVPDCVEPFKDLLVRGLLEPLLKDFVANGSVSHELRELISKSAVPQYSH